MVLSGQGCPRKTEECKTNKPEEQKAGTPVWIWIVVVALLSTYSLAATITALIIWVSNSRMSPIPRRKLNH